MPHRYRYPTDILWAHPDGFKYVEAERAEAAVENAPDHIKLPNLQVHAGAWRWASETSRSQGGYWNGHPNDATRAGGRT